MHAWKNFLHPSPYGQICMPESCKGQTTMLKSALSLQDGSTKPTHQLVSLLGSGQCHADFVNLERCYLPHSASECRKSVSDLAVVAHDNYVCMWLCHAPVLLCLHGFVVSVWVTCLDCRPQLQDVLNARLMLTKQNQH